MSLSIYVLNDLADLRLDEINSPKRPLASKTANKSDAIVLVSLLNCGGLAIALSYGVATFLIVLAEIVLGLGYSFKPLSLKDRFLAKTFSIGAGGMLASFFGGVAAGNINSAVIYAAIMFLVFLFVTSPINDLADMVGDKVDGRRTIPIVIGPKNTVKLAILVGFVPLASSLLALPRLGLSVLTLILFALLTARSITLLIPLLKEFSDPKLVRRHHKRIVPLHLLLQASLMLGTLPILPQSTW
jgi:4-hydroxybenzoate polyprenyltransferase